MKANRETIVLIAVACAMTFALSRHAGTPEVAAEKPAAAVVPDQVWTGRLAEVAPAASVPPREPMSSASLVVPKSALALPATPRKTPVKVAVPVPPTRTQMAGNTQAASVEPDRSSHEDGLLHSINPMNHLPDMSSVGRPLAYAGETVAGWFRHF